MLAAVVTIGLTFGLCIVRLQNELLLRGISTVDEKWIIRGDIVRGRYQEETESKTLKFPGISRSRLLFRKV